MDGVAGSYAGSRVPGPAVRVCIENGGKGGQGRREGGGKPYHGDCRRMVLRQPTSTPYDNLGKQPGVGVGRAPSIVGGGETDAGPRAISSAEIFKLTWRALGKGKQVELPMPRGHQAKWGVCGDRNDRMDGRVR